MAGPLCLGLDAGTGGCRAAVLDEGGGLVASAAVAWPPPRCHGPAVEQDPETWWAGLLAAIQELGREVDLHRVAALAVAGTSGTVLLASERGRPLGPALMYNDQRAINEAAAIRERAPAGAPVHGPGSGLAHALWLARRAPAGARHLLHQADWLAGRLCGHFDLSDWHNALKTGFDPEARCWPPWLDGLPLPRGLLPRVLPPGSVMGRVTPAAAEATGLAPGTVVAAGTTDGNAGFLATGAARAGEAVTSLGSTLVLKVLSPVRIDSPEHGIYSHRLDDLWLAGGASNAGGAVLKRFFTDARLRELEPELDPDRPTGLDYYPLPAPGERFPVNDPGLQPRLTPRPESDARFLQGLLEGLAEIEYTGYRLLRELGAPWPEVIYTVGGGARNAAWRRIRARRLAVPMRDPRHEQPACGAARLARRALEADNDKRGSP